MALSNTPTFDVNPIAINPHDPAVTIQLPFYLLKSHTRNSSFCGRKDILTQLEKALLPDFAINLVQLSGPAGPRVFAIRGMGGLGKTGLAAEFALTQMKHFDAVFWLDPYDTTKLAKDFNHMSMALGLEEMAIDQALSRDIVLEWLSGSNREISSVKGPTSEPRWLLIFDSADDLIVLVDNLPASGNGSIVVTTRISKAVAQSWWHQYPAADGIDLGPFSKPDARTIIRTLEGSNRSEADVQLSQEIAEKLGCLPLAMTQVARAITPRNLSLRDSLEFLQCDSDRIDAYKSTDSCSVAGSTESHLLCMGA